MTFKHLRSLMVIMLTTLLMINSGHSASHGLKMDIQRIQSSQKGQQKLRLILEMDTGTINGISTEASIALKKATQNIPIQITRQFQYSPMVVVEVHRNNLFQLLSISGLKHIHVDQLSLPSLDDSIPFVGADTVWQMGYSGEGQLVAVIDTGVDRNHQFLSNKVVSEACFSSQSSSYNSYSLCPDEQEISTGENSARPCPSTIDGCYHGTHVAGIVAGRGDNFSGVARDASIMAIQVFSEFRDSSINNNICQRMGKKSPCIMSFVSDQIQALEFIYDQKNNWQVASVNMSLSGGKPFAKPCDSDPRSHMINQLHAIDIAVIASAGNSGYDHAIGAPSCISHVISVGAVNNHDKIQQFSNSCDLLDIFAPGAGIQSSIPLQKFSQKSGTSMAAPHVAGAWAVLRSKGIQASNDDLLFRIKHAAPLLTDSRNQLQHPRLQIDWAISDTPILTSNKPIENTVNKHEWHYYRILNRHAECQYTVKLDHISDDADLYVRHKDLPSTDDWDGRPYKGYQQSEAFTFHARETSVWFVGVYGYRQSQYNLSLNEHAIYSLDFNTPQKKDIQEGEWHYYSLSIALNETCQVQLDSLKGDTDLYYQVNQFPHENNYLLRSIKNARYPDLCVIEPVAPGTFAYLGVFGYQAGSYRIQLKKGE